MPKRQAQTWALIIAENVYEHLRSGTPLPFQLPGQPLPKGLAIRTIQEVGSAKRQLDVMELDREHPRHMIPWSLRWGPSVAAPEQGEDNRPAAKAADAAAAAQPHFHLLVDRPASTRRATSDRMLQFAHSTSRAASGPSFPPPPPGVVALQLEPTLAGITELDNLMEDLFGRKDSE